MVIAFVLIVAGFAGLILGANWLVNGASALARKNHIPDLIIGFTIVAFSTSAPELVVNAVASVNGLSDIVLANVIGSNNLNLFLILGVAGLVYPITVQSSTAWREIPVSLVITVILFMLANEFFVSDNLAISRVDGLILLSLFLGFLFYMYRQMKADKANNTHNVAASIAHEKSNLLIWGLILAGFAGLIVGGKLVVDNSIAIATDLGVSQKIIGLTIIAAGTSLPELVTSVVAALKKNSDIAIGNVIGSNIFNILFILSVSSLISPVAFKQNFNQDLYILAGGTVFLMIAMLTGKKKKLDRWEALILVCFYLLYTCYLVSKEL